MWYLSGNFMNMLSFLHSADLKLHYMSTPTELPVFSGKRSHAAVGVRATQQSLEAAPVPAEYQTVIFSACLEFTSHYRMCTTL